MIEDKVRRERSPMEKRRLRISSKRQLTIPVKYFEGMGLTNEVDCIYANNMLIIKPPRDEGSAFAEEILSDLINQGYSGQKLLTEFRRINRQIRSAIEKPIEEADSFAKAASENYIDKTDDIFGIDDQEQ